MLEFISIIIIVFLDQAVKYWAVMRLKPIGDFPVWNGIFHLTYAENTGAAFSILRGYTVFLTIVPIIAIIGIVYLLLSKRIERFLGRLSLVFILSGAIGNLIDRIFRGYVVDLFNFKLIRFAIFNVADTFISIGAVALFAYVLFFSERKDIKNG